MVLSPRGRIIQVNQAWQRVTGYLWEEVKDAYYWDLILIPEEEERVRAVFTGLRPQQFPYRHEERWKTKDGAGCQIALVSTALTDLEGSIEFVITSGFDITHIKQVEEQLKHLSLHDPATGLYNRAYFEEEMRRLEGGRGGPVGMILCDLDGLKLVNDTLGHDVGDILLVATAEIIKQCFRKSDVVARIGGDEFAVLLPNSTEESVENAYHRIKTSIEAYNAGKPAHPISISVGFALSDEPPVSMSELFKEADKNMYREKLRHSQTSRDSTVQTMLKDLEAKDFLREGHTERLQVLAVGLARVVGLTDRLGLIRRLAQFHDLGKLSLPESMLLKPGPLTHEERLLVDRHSEIGHRIALSVPELAPIADLILKHHEWWDGSGYPLGLKGEAVPIECRILAVAEAYELMTSGRPYRKPVSHEDAVVELKRCAGTQFDPKLVDRFILMMEKKRRSPGDNSQQLDQYQLSLPFYIK